MRIISKGVETATNAYVKDRVIYTVAELARSTPIDVGTARSNWTVSLGTAIASIRRAFSPFPSRWKPRPGLAPGGGQGETRNQAGAVWAATAVMQRRKTDDPVYILNALPYIERLNEGHSPRAPAGWIGRAIQRASRRAASDAQKTYDRELR